ncbi:hypothetical protein B7463_g3820, partial [Scytalidium lignicola]
MTSKGLPQDMLYYNVVARDTANDFSRWLGGEVLRIEVLSEVQVLSELQGIMEGDNYSWHSINELLQNQLDKEALEFTLTGGDVVFEWNNLCDEKQKWERKGCLSINDVNFNRDCLINLKILPFKAGLLKNSESEDNLDYDDCLSWVVEDSEESEDGGAEIQWTRLSGSDEDVESEEDETS